MSETVELRLILRNTETASRDAHADLEATERLAKALAPRLDAIEARIGGLEHRVTSVETGIDQIARSNARMERALADILAAVEDGAPHRDAGLEPPSP